MFQFHPDNQWIEIETRVDPERWGAAMAAEIWSTSGLEPDWLREKVLGSQLTLLAAGARDHEAGAALILYPTPGDAPVAVLEVLVADMPEVLTRAEIVQELTLPPDALLGDVGVADLHTNAGPAVRVRQHQVTMLDGDPRAVLAVINYGWQVPAERALLVATIAFIDLVAAEQLLPAVDDLARGLELIDASTP